MSLMEKIAKSVLVGILLVACLNTFSPTPVKAELPPIGDLTLTENAIEEIINATLAVNGSIIIKNNATLRIINSILTFNSPNYNITLKEPSNGNPRLIIINSNISCRTTRDYQGFSIYIYGNSSVSIKNSYIERVIINARDSSKVDIQKITAAIQMNFYKTAILNATSLNFINLREPYRFTSRLECFDNSKVFISDTRAETSIYVRGWDSSTLTLKKCGTSWAIQLYEKSSLYLTGGNVDGRIELNDTSYAEISSPSLLKTFKASGYASARIYNTTIIFSTTEKTALSDFSTLFVENVKVRQSLSLSGSARLSAINSQLRQVEMQDGTVLTAINTQLENLAAYGSSTLFISGKSQLNCTFREYSLALITSTYSTTSFISATDNAKLIVSQSTLMGKMSINKKATLHITESKIQWLEIKDSAIANITKATVSSYLGIFDSAKISVADTKINILTTSKISETTIEKSNVSAINSFDSSKINIKASFVGEIAIYIDSVLCAFENLSYTTTSYTAPNRVTIIRRGYTPTITLSNTVVKSWNVFIMGDSNVNFTNCRLDTLKVSGNSTITFYNTTVSRMTVNDNSQAYVYWYLDVLAYNGTSISVRNEKGEVVFQANVVDKARIILLEKIINASTIIVSNKYAVLFDKDGQQQQYNVELTSNIVIDLTASKGVEWTVLGMGIAAVVIALFAVALWIKFHGIPKGFRSRIQSG